MDTEVRSWLTLVVTVRPESDFAWIACPMQASTFAQHSLRLAAHVWFFATYFVLVFRLTVCIQPIVIFPTLCFWLCLLMFVRSTWGNVVSQVGKGSSATDLAMRNSTAGIAAHHAGASTMQRATPRMVCFYFFNVLFLVYSGGGNLVLSLIHHHTQLWYCLSFITNSLSLPSLTSWAHVFSMAEVLFVQNLHISFPEILLPNVWGAK